MIAYYFSVTKFILEKLKLSTIFNEINVIIFVKSNLETIFYELLNIFS